MFVTDSLPTNDFIVAPPRPIPMPAFPLRPVQRGAEPSPNAPMRSPVRAEAAEIRSTDDYGEVRLLPSDQPLDALITKIATVTGLNFKRLHALVIIESAYNTRAINPVGTMASHN